MEFHNFEIVQDADDEDAVHIGDMRHLHEDLREVLDPALREALPAALRQILSAYLHGDRLRHLLNFLPAAQRERLSAFVLDGRLADLLNDRWEVLHEPDGIREPGILPPDHPRIVIDNRHLEDEAAVHIGGMRPLHEDLREALHPALSEALPNALHGILLDHLHDHRLRYLLTFLPAAQRERLSAFVLDGRLADLLNDRWEVLDEPDGIREPGILRPDHPRIGIHNRRLEVEAAAPIDDQPDLQRPALHVEPVGEPVLEPNDN